MISELDGGIPTSPYPNITVKVGDILTSTAQTRVNPVNCVGVMGTGLAKQFKDAYPLMFEQYADLCERGLLEPGKLFAYMIPDENRIILNFPTKVHWKNGSRMDYIVSGLRKFVDRYKEYGITSGAFPMLGCRNGGLKITDVFPVMCEFFRAVDIPVEVWFLEPEKRLESFELF